jgi:hypothetical protein
MLGSACCHRMLVVTLHFNCTQIIIVVDRREEGVQGRVQGIGSGGFEDVNILLTAKSNVLRDFKSMPASCYHYAAYD